MANEVKKPEKRRGISGLIFVGCLMLGFAIGFLTGQLPVGIFGGMGIGFIAMAIVRYKLGEW